MSDNPYASPRADLTPTPRPGQRSEELRRELRLVATCQRYAILANFAQVFFPPPIAGLVWAIYSSNSLPPEVVQAVGVAILSAIMIAACASAVALARQLFGPVAGIILGALAIVPCLSVLIVFFLNYRASLFLDEHGVEVGIMGADVNSI